jgi:phospholipase/carboxylesterase
MRLDSLGPLRWVFPRAPVRPVSVNNGHRMRAWYDIYAGTDARDPFSRQEDEAGLRDSFAGVHALLDREIARGVPAEFIQRATAKVAEINAAWDRIKRERKL